MRSLELLDDDVQRIMYRLHEGRKDLLTAIIKRRTVAAFKLPWFLETLEDTERVMAELRGMMVAYRACALQGVPVEPEQPKAETAIVREWRQEEQKAELQGTA